jgi:MFS transporter, DHA2 family, multidrug resistance protein
VPIPESLGGSALARANGLPGHTGEALRSAAEAAFTAELHTIAAISAILLAEVAILIAATLRHIPPLGEERPTEAVELEAADRAGLAQLANA